MADALANLQVANAGRLTGDAPAPRETERWSPRLLLAAMDRFPELTIRDLAEQMGGEVTDVSRWKRSDPSFFKVEYERRMEARGVPGRRGAPKPLFIDEELLARLHDFITVFARSGKLHYACEVAEVGFGVVRRLIDPAAPDYDPDFHQAYLEAESPHLAKIEDIHRDEALAGNLTAGKFILKSRHPNYRPQLEVKSDRTQAPPASVNITSIRVSIEQRARELLATTEPPIDVDQLP